MSTDYYKQMDLTHQELKSVMKRCEILISKPNQHAALLRAYSDLILAADSLDQAITHFEREEERCHGQKKISEMVK